ncbi:MAG: RNA polymerase sigma factor [Isosphaeraceae bacterium]
MMTGYAQWLYLRCRNDGLKPQDATDVTQEVLVAVYTGIPSFRHDRPGDSFRAWMETVRYHKVADFYRKRRGQPHAIGGDDGAERFRHVPIERIDTPASLAPLLQSAVDLVRDEFEVESWQAFWLTVVDERSAADVAKELNKSTDAVYQAKSRILRRLRETLENPPS